MCCELMGDLFGSDRTTSSMPWNPHDGPTAGVGPSGGSSGQTILRAPAALPHAAAGSSILYSSRDVVNVEKRNSAGRRTHAYHNFQCAEPVQLRRVSKGNKLRSKLFSQLSQRAGRKCSKLGFR